MKKKILVWILLAMLLVGLGINGYCLLFIVPTFVDIFEDFESTEVTYSFSLPAQITIETCNIFRSWYVALPLIIGVVVLIIWPIRKGLLRLPMWQLILLIPVFIVLIGILQVLFITNLFLPIFEMTKTIR